MSLAEQAGGHETVERGTWLGPNTAELEGLIRASQDEAASEEERRTAFGMFAEQTYDNVVHLATRFTGSEDDGQDVAQETFWKVWKYLPSFRGDAPFNEWLYTVTANAAFTFRKYKARRERREKLAPLSLRATTDEKVTPFNPIDADESHDPEARAEKKMNQDRLHEALGGLSVRLQTPVVLRDVYDRTYKEIAEILDISETTAKVRVHRARKRLKDKMFDKKS